MVVRWRCGIDVGGGVLGHNRSIERYIYYTEHLKRAFSALCISHGQELSHVLRR